MSDLAEPKRPTEKARFKLAQAAVAASFAQAENTQTGGDKYKKDIALSLEKIASGLTEMAIGMRATYILLEKIERRQRNR